MAIVSKCKVIIVVHLFQMLSHGYLRSRLILINRFFGSCISRWISIHWPKQSVFNFLIRNFALFFVWFFDILLYLSSTNMALANCFSLSGCQNDNLLRKFFSESVTNSCVIVITFLMCVTVSDHRRFFGFFRIIKKLMICLNNNFTRHKFK